MPSTRASLRAERMANAANSRRAGVCVCVRVCVCVCVYFSPSTTRIQSIKYRCCVDDATAVSADLRT